MAEDRPVDIRKPSFAKAKPFGTSKPAVTGRTSKYLFSGSQVEPPMVEDDDEEARKYRERMHKKFVQKLGRPDSIAEIKRGNHFISEETEDVGEGAEDEEEEEAPKSRGRKGAATKKGGSKLTPMEKQVIDIKKKHMDTLLVVEVGYKYRFFGEDARIVAKELGIVCIPGKMRYDEHPSEAHLDRFASASFPTHRLHVHVKRLVSAGHKVGVVRQLETAALKKAGDNRNAPFVRKLTNLYTKGTYIDDTEGLDSPAAAPASATTNTGHLLCLTETGAKGWGSDEKVRIGIVAVQPTTGDVIYDDFEDGFMRSELETRLLHIAPCEFLIVGDISKATDKLIQHLSDSKINVFGDRARVERVEKPKTMAAQAYSHISDFYAGKLKPDESSEEKSAMLDKVHQLSELVTVCLSAEITHLTDYGLEHVFDLTKYFQSFSARSHMLLNGNTLSSLEIYQNQTDYTDKGSLFWTLDRTQTRFGQRLLRKWVGRPLLDQAQLNQRIAAVEELLDVENSMSVDKIRHLLKQVKGDLEKSLIRIYYKKCARPELLAVLQTLQAIANEYAHVKSRTDSGFKSDALAESIVSLPKIADNVVSYLERINLQAAKSDDKYSFFREEHETEDITNHRVGIISVEYDLNQHRAEAAKTLRKSKIDYTTVSGIEFLIEVENTQLKAVPASWIKISGTKKVSRFHTPEVIKLVRERDQQKEALANACDVAFIDLLSKIGAEYQIFRDCIQSLATLDCLLSLAEIASQPGYTKPEFVSDPEEICIEVSEARHPMVEQLLLDAYVPNDIALSSQARALLITGPNMGGKSSYVRSVALISIMAQIGSWVPASSARLSLLDAVFTRMGAFDNMLKGESTFMVELSETSDILKQATPRSLIILDELGRGTSTHDGVAIAQAVLDHLVRDSKALTLFITHYQALARMAEQYSPDLKNVHMKFREDVGADGHPDVTFLYEVGEGVAHRSYGLNVARLAGLPRSVLDVAAVRSAQMEEEGNTKRLTYLARMLGAVAGGEGSALEALVAGIEQL
ncbi:DNA mismatch repair protein-like protein msh3 [Delphinella strobiligena]|nr:DNA mismatch repair protein-like protein msh3 [Delphinella strobiligena]